MTSLEDALLTLGEIIVIAGCGGFAFMCGLCLFDLVKDAFKK